MGTNPQAFNDLGSMKSRDERNGKVRAQKESGQKRNMEGYQKGIVTVLKRIHTGTIRESTHGHKITYESGKGNT